MQLLVSLSAIRVPGNLRQKEKCGIVKNAAYTLKLKCSHLQITNENLHDVLTCTEETKS